MDALIEGLKEGYIQVISTDHAPHTQKDKTGSMRTAAFGIVGIETSFALRDVYKRQTHDNGISGKTNEDYKSYLSKACKEI